MNDFLRESFSYPGIYAKLFKVKKEIHPTKVSFGADKNQYFYFFEPECVKSDKIIIWVHGGGWNAGTPKFFEYVGQCFAKEGYRCISLGYRLSPKNKYPCQIEDVCTGFNKAVEYLKKRNIDTSKIIVSGPSAGAHLTSILCYSKEDQDKYSVDVSNVIGFIGVAGPYIIKNKLSWTLRTLLNQLFEKDYDRSSGDPYSLMTQNKIPMLLIHSEHDGLIDYSSSQLFYDKAISMGIDCELYSVTDRKNTHSWYSAGMFLENRQDNKGLDKLFDWIEKI